MGFVEQISWLAGGACSGASAVRAVPCNLSARGMGSLPGILEQEDAERMEFGHAPKEGIRLDMVGREPGVFDRRRPRRRVGGEADLGREVPALAHGRNQVRTIVSWRLIFLGARGRFKCDIPSHPAC